MGENNAVEIPRAAGGGASRGLSWGTNDALMAMHTSRWSINKEQNKGRRCVGFRTSGLLTANSGRFAKCPPTVPNTGKQAPTQTPPLPLILRRGRNKARLFLQPPWFVFATHP